jgi:hypothetical protein
LESLGTCELELYAQPHVEGVWPRVETTSWVKIDESAPTYKWQTTEFSVKRDEWQAPDGLPTTIFASIHLPDFCPMYNGTTVVRRADFQTPHLFAVRCGGELVARSPHFFPNAALTMINPVAYSTYYSTTTREFRIQLVIADSLRDQLELEGEKEQYLPQYVNVGFELYSPDSDHPDRARTPPEPIVVPGVEEDIWLVGKFDTRFDNAYINEWAQNDEARLDPPLLIEADIELGLKDYPDGRYYLRPTFSDAQFYTPIIIANPATVKPYIQCDAGTVGAVMSARAYGSDVVSFGEYRTSFATTPHCFHMTQDGSLMSTMDFLVIASFAAAETHVSAYGSPALVNSYYSDGRHRHAANILVIAFRGTAKEADWSSNLDSTAVSCDDFDLPCTVHDDDDGGPGELHRGFAVEYQAVRSIVDTFMRPIIDNNVDTTVIFTGHSQGGAIATIAALDFANRVPPAVKVNVVTMGSPRVGFGDFKTMYGRLVGHENHLRVEAKRDPVTILPPFFDHVGTLVDVPCSSWFAVINCHSVDNYVAHTSRIERPEEFVSHIDSVNQWTLAAAAHRAGDTTLDTDESSGSLSTGTIIAIVASSVVACLCMIALVAAVVFVVLRRNKRTHRHHATLSPASPYVGRSRSGSTARHHRSSMSRRASESRMRQSPHMPTL